MVSFSLLVACTAAAWVTLTQASPLQKMPIVERAAGTKPLPPTQDPFYTAPAGFQSAAPGTILRLREAPGSLTTAVANSSAAYNIVFRTTDSRYRPAWAVTTLFVPLAQPHATSNATNSSSSAAPLLSYQIAYDSVDLDASPSYTLYKGEPDVSAALGRGWFVNVPDYEGPLASFVAGVQSGHATLDSVRAVLRSGFGLPANAKSVMMGYSGGALASEWAAELQVQYAPELTFSGAALGGLTPNVSSVLDTVNGAIGAGLIVPGILGLASQHPELNQLVQAQLKTTGPFNRTGFYAAKNYTLNQAIAAYINHDIYQYFEDGEALIQVPFVQRILNSDGIMGYHGVPQFPLFAYKAIADEISPIADTDKLVSRYCEVGASILYERNTVGGHLAEGTNGDSRAVQWLSGILDGTIQQPAGCVIRNVTVAIDTSPLRKRRPTFVYP